MRVRPVGSAAAGVVAAALILLGVYANASASPISASSGDVAAVTLGNGAGDPVRTIHLDVPVTSQPAWPADLDRADLLSLQRPPVPAAVATIDSVDLDI